MTQKEIVRTDKAPRPLGPYSQAVSVGNLLFLAGAVSVNLDSKPVEGDTSVQTRQILENVKGVLESAGASMKDVVKTTVFLTDMGDFQAMNEVYSQYFKEEPPARSTIGVKSLARDYFKVEIEAIAVIPGK